MSRPPALRDDPREREYRAHRQDVLNMLHARFPGVPDHEEIYQEAWAEALEREARGHDLTDAGGLLMTIAWRRARDRLRRHGAEAIDPGSLLFQRQVDPSSSPEEQLERRVDAALIRDIVDALDDQHAAVLKLRFGRNLSSREIGQALGLKTKTLENVITEAYRAVEQALATTEQGETPWRRRQQSLLLACEIGVATAGQRRRAHRIVEQDPVCRAMLREIRATLNRVAAILPLPILIEERPRRWALLRMDLNERLASVRDQLADLASRIGGHSGAVEQASAGGLAGLGGGVALKTALICMAVGGGTVVCVDSGLLRHPHRSTPRQQQFHRRDTSSAAKPRPLAEHRPAPVPAATTTRSQPTKTVGASATTPTSTSASATPPPSPVPAGSTEFGVGSVGSQPASNTPAPAPQGGGGEFLP